MFLFTPCRYPSSRTKAHRRRTMDGMSRTSERENSKRQPHLRRKPSMNSNAPKKNKLTAASLSRPVFNRYPDSDVESECKRILAWFATHLILTTEDGIYELKIAHLNERIRTLRERGHVIDRTRAFFYTRSGGSKKTTVYFLRRELKPDINDDLELKCLLERVPGFETTDIDQMKMREKFILGCFLKKLE
jgi:Helix-turn-helix domain